MVVIVLLEALLLLGLGYEGGRRLITDIGQAAHEEEHARVEIEIKGVLRQLTSAVRALAASPSLSRSADAETRNAELIWSLLSEADALDSLYLARRDGTVLGVQRRPEPAVRRIQLVDGRLSDVREYKASMDQLTLHPSLRFATLRSERRATSYDVREEGWFQGTVNGERADWSSPHPMAFSGTLGITFAAPAGLRGGDDRLEAVAAGDISLDHLTRLAGSFSHASAGESALVTADELVIARSDGKFTPGRLEKPGEGDVLHTILAGLAGRQGAVYTSEFGGAVYLVRASTIAGTPWKLVSWLPQDAVLGGLKRALRTAAIVLGLCVVMATLLSVWLSRRISQPVEVLARVARRIGRLELDRLPRVDSRVEEIHRLDEALAESARSLQAFRKFVPGDIVGELVKQGRPLEPAGAQVPLTVMFTDIEGFTGIAAHVPPEQLVPQLTEYFSIAGEVVVRHHGTIDKYIGDGMMVLWGAPAPLEDAPYHACRAALALQEALEAQNEAWAARGLPRLHTRIGLHAGVAVAGVFGSSERLSFTAFGDTVNLASRIEAMNKELGTRILASQPVVDAVAGRVEARPRAEVELRGRPGRWWLYEIVGALPR